MMELNKHTAGHMSNQCFEGMMSDTSGLVTKRYQSWHEWSEAGESIQKEQNEVYAKWQKAKAGHHQEAIARWEVKLQELSWRIEEHMKHEPEP